MKFKELKSLSKEDLKNKLYELKKEMIKLNTQISSGANLKSPGLVKKTKKTIARIMYLLKNKGEN